jgi:hypothetical protein
VFVLLSDASSTGISFYSIKNSASYIFSEFNKVGVLTVSDSNTKPVSKTVPLPAPLPPRPSSSMPTKPDDGHFFTTKAAINTPVVVDGVQYIIESGYDYGAKLPSDWGYYQKSNGGKYILVKLIAKNIGKTELIPRETVFFVTDSERRQYWQLSDFAFSLMMGGPSGYTRMDQTSFRPTSLKPGFSVKLFYIAEVSSESTGISAVVANQDDQNFEIPLGI